MSPGGLLRSSREAVECHVFSPKMGSVYVESQGVGRVETTRQDVYCMHIPTIKQPLLVMWDSTGSLAEVL